MVHQLNEEIAKEIKKLALTKQLNILIGSGCSTPAIPLMGEYFKYGDRANEYLIKRITSVSKLLTCKTNKNNKVSKTKIGNQCRQTSESYYNFLDRIIDLLIESNSRQVPKAVNIFTTNYDLFIENAVNELHHLKRMVFNDGASGYFHRVLDSTNYNRVVAYRGLNNNFISEIPSINLIKSHGSVNWEVKGEKVIVSDRVVDKSMIVPPSGIEGQDTFLNNYFHDMLRVFQLELDKPQSVLLVIGFSFQDKHIAKMFRRALQNPELKVYIFSYSNEIGYLQKNLEFNGMPSNLKIIAPSNIFSFSDDESNKEDVKFYLDDLTRVLSIDCDGDK